MKIKVWSGFKKKDNSTKTPDTAGKEINVLLKENCSKRTPVFELSEPIPNYDYVQAFGNYYFITDIVNISATQCEIYCDIDVLASYKADILSYTAFVERSASTYDITVNDELLTSQQKVITETVTNTDISIFGTGCYIAEVLTKSEGIVLYVTPDLEPYKQILVPACYSLLDVENWIESGIAQAFDLDVYIGTVKWVPFDAADIGTQTNTFYIGPVDVGVPTSYIIRRANQNHYIRSVIDITLPTSGMFGDFRDTNPNFTQYNIRLPGVGIADLDPLVIGSAILNNNTVHLDIDIDLVSGDIVYTLSIGQYRSMFARFKGNISVNVPIGKSVSDVSQSAAMVVGGVASGAMAGGAAGAVIGGIVGLVQAVHNEMKPQTSVIGGSGNKADLYATRASVLVSRRQFGSKDFPQTVAGRPLFQNITLSNLSGFVKCGGASVPISGDETERTKLNGYLNGGFYIE